MNDLLTTGQVAELLNVGPRTVLRWSKRGQLRTVLMPSGQRRFLKSDVEAILGGVPVCN